LFCVSHELQIIHMSVCVGLENDSTGRETGHSLENKRVIGLISVSTYSVPLVRARKQLPGDDLLPGRLWLQNLLHVDSLRPGEAAGSGLGGCAGVASVGSPGDAAFFVVEGFEQVVAVELQEDASIKNAEFIAGVPRVHVLEPFHLPARFAPSILCRSPSKLGVN